MFTHSLHSARAGCFTSESAEICMHALLTIILQFRHIGRSLKPERLNRRRVALEDRHPACLGLRASCPFNYAERTCWKRAGRVRPEQPPMKTRAEIIWQKIVD